MRTLSGLRHQEECARLHGPCPEKPLPLPQLGMDGWQQTLILWWGEQIQKQDFSRFSVRTTFNFLQGILKKKKDKMQLIQTTQQKYNHRQREKERVAHKIERRFEDNAKV